MDFPRNPPIAPMFISTPMQPCTAQAVQQGTAAISAAYNPVKERAIYIPFHIYTSYPVNRVFWVNGSTVTSSENQFGIYSSSGGRIYATKKTALSGASQTQYSVPAAEHKGYTAPFILPVGSYYFALLFVSGTVTSRWFGVGATLTAAQVRSTGIRQQSGITELPAEATFANAESLKFPHIGITFMTTGF